MEEKELIWQVERDVLDQQHRQLDLFRRRSPLAVGHLLKVYGDGIRDVNRGVDTRTFVEARFKVNMMGYGLGHCLRWLLENQVTSVVLPAERWEVLDREAAEFLGWGTAYSLLANDRTAWKANLITAEVDQARKRITFGLPAAADGCWFVQQIEAQQATIDERVGDRPDETLRADCIAWVGDSQLLQSGGLQGDYRRRPRTVAQAMEAWVSRSVLPTLDGSEDLTGFSLTQFRMFVSSLLPFCLYHCWFEDEADRRFGQTHPFGSQPMMLAGGRFLKWTCEVSGLSEDAAKAIIEMLTFDPSRFHERVTYRPFVVLADQTLLTSPRLWGLLNLERLLVGALNASGRKRVYDHLINQIETSQVKEIAAFLRRCAGWKLACQRSFHAGGVTITPDFVIWEPDSDRILVIDYKHAMEASGPVEVTNRLSDFSKWIKRLGEYKAFFSGNWSVLKDEFGRTLKQVPAAIDGLILSRWPLALPVAECGNIAVADWGGFQRFSSTDEGCGIGLLLEWAAIRPEIQRPNQVIVVPQEIHVGDWTYVRNAISVAS
jgi:hypothetical protein